MTDNVTKFGIGGQNQRRGPKGLKTVHPKIFIHLGFQKVEVKFQYIKYR